MSNELKPCPCCGSKATLINRGADTCTINQIQCCKCFLVLEDYSDDESLIKAWNTRHIPEGYALVSKAQIMTWYDVLQEAIESPQYDHEVRAKSAIGQMIKAAQEEGE